MRNQTSRVVGLGGLEPPTSPLSGARSNHLSYRPKKISFPTTQHRHAMGCENLAWCARWWSLSGSNRRPPACKAGALPAELRPRNGTCLINRIDQKLWMQVTCVDAYKKRLSCSKGGDPAAPSDTATLLRLHPSHRPHRGKRPPCG